MQDFSNDGNTPPLAPQFPPCAPDAPSGGRWWRRTWLAAGLLGALAVQVAHADTLPRRNLLVEWRVSGSEQGTQRAAGLQRGRIVIDSRGGVMAGAQGAWQSTQTENRRDSVQQVQVLNGGRARLYVGQTQPYTTWIWAWQGDNGSTGASGASNGTASSTTSADSWRQGASLVAQTVWIDLGQGLNVRPRWAGGRADVEVELEARASHAEQPGGFDSGRLEPDGQIRRMEVASTLRVPLGEWVVVARQGGQRTAESHGTVSTRDVDSSEQAVLEIRISAP